MTEQAQLIEAVLTAPPERRQAILQAARGADRARMGTVRDAAAVFTPPVCTRTIERWARQGLFPRVHLSPRKVRYDLAAVERFAVLGREVQV